MPLACTCDFFDDASSWFWDGEAQKYVPYPFKRRRRCCSCKELINMDEQVTEHIRRRFARDEIECDIYGEDGEIKLASDWMCEECSDLYFSLTELKYCVLPRDNMRELVAEYANRRQKDEI